ncbi:MAG: heme lyase CcmF/NrfE family subunit [Pseudomonadota bacterium]|nr:heme lyase CcmF/NrfE family subunit [Pseudomonadota bacterium]
MTIELGHFSAALGMAVGLLLAVLPLWGSHRNQASWMQLARPLATLQLVLVAIAYLALTRAFLVDDFSVAYVAANSNTQLPTVYKFSAVWGAHEGSLLLWLLFLTLWTALVARFSRHLPLPLVARTLAVLGWVAVGFHLFLLLTSNPFERLLPVPAIEGQDLNPLLQDPGLVIHPPMLYLGYVGFAVPFAFAVAALLGGRLDAAWARWSRPWTNMAWVFLTLGITLGSWWAYYELGWGGWWFWDPVENASFMPWLTGTALVHSLAVTEKRGAFKGWTVLLAIFTFSLSLLGTFLVRSGILTSVHAFAVDPTRGAFIFAFLVVVVGGSLALFAWRAPSLSGAVQMSGWSRETLLLINNLLLTVSALSVLAGTLYPLVFEALSGGRKVSVGPPYFNAVFVPLMALLMLAMALGPLMRWRSTALADLRARLLWVIGAVAVAVAAGPWLLGHAWVPATAAAIGLAVWLIGGLVADLWRQAGLLRGKGGVARLGAGYWGMQLAHLGVAFTALGVVLVSQHSTEQDLRMAPGDSVELAGYRLTFEAVDAYSGPNYEAQRGRFLVAHPDGGQSLLLPEKRRYLARGNVMTEAGIDPGATRDLYIALGEPLAGGAWAVRLQYKAYVRWIWLGGVLMAAGGGLAVVDRRYRLKRQRNPVPAAASGIA